MKSKAMKAISSQGRKHIRCAIYTRKSTEEGLDQAFNSLDAQREACAAYIVSQRHEGWVPTDELYDDGGYTGGNMDRPGLKQLLAEVQAGKVDVIVVYKVDRLTRALSDFAKIVDVLDAAGASFVSITQSFNTTTSMGRLTLNVLLSFAQFEREVISERVRDKVAASKRKGMWMGGSVPLGYDLKDRKLIVNEAEAETIRHIMRRYLAFRSVRELMTELARDRIYSKLHRAEDGTTRGGKPIGRGAIYGLLAAHVYVGEVAHKGLVYKGEHDAIVPRDLWDAVQALLATNRVERHHQTNAVDPSMLAGLIRDGEGRRMTPSHARRANLRYRYYVSVNEGDAPHPRLHRIPAGEIERGIIAGLSDLLADHATLMTRLAAPLLGKAIDAKVTLDAADVLRRDLATLLPSQLRALMLELGVIAVVQADRINASIELTKLARRLGCNLPLDLSIDHVIENRMPLAIASIMACRGTEVRLTILPSMQGESPSRDRRLVELIVRAHNARRKLALDGRSVSDSEVMNDAQRAALLRIARLSFLAPDIVIAIMSGCQPITLSARRLLRVAGLPNAWADQRRMLGFT